MAQDGTTAGGSSYTIDNVTFPVGRTKLQSIFDAIRSTNIGNTAPDLVAGQFWIDNNTPSTTVWTLYLYDGTDNISFATIDTINNTVNFLDSTFDLINDTTPQLGGGLDLNSNDITGTGNINITGSITSSSFYSNGGTINSGNNLRFNRIGTQTSGLHWYQTNNNEREAEIEFSNTENLMITNLTSNNIYLRTNDAPRVAIQGNGDISFYEDTGTTPKFFWDASTERLGIGTTSPSNLLHLSSDTPVPLKLDRTTNADSYILYKNTTDEWTAGLDTSEGFVIANGSLITTNPRLTIDSSGNVGIGTSSPQEKLHIETPTGSASETGLKIRNGTSVADAMAQIKLQGGYAATSSEATAIISGGRESTGNGSKLTFSTGQPATERMRINRYGNVGIGTSSPGTRLSFGNYVPSNGQTIHTYQSGNTVSGLGIVSSVHRMFTNSGSSISFGHVSTSDGSTYSEAMRINSSGNVGIGTSSPDRPLTVKEVSNVAISVIKSTGEDILHIGEHGGDGIATYNSITNGAHIFLDNGTEHMRINGVGNVLVGKSAIGTSVVGCEIRQDGLGSFTRDGNTPVIITRKTSDGEIISVRKDGTTVGSIGTTLGDLFIGTGDTGLRFHDGDNSIYSVNGTTGVKIDATIDLGEPAGRFKDLYLSGGAFLGGTGTANKLDDYEEGEFTPTYTTSGDQLTSITYASFTGGSYVKVGRLVMITGFIRTTAITEGTPSGSLRLSGLPFAVAGSSGGKLQTRGSISLADQNNWDTNHTPNTGALSEATSYIQLKKIYGENDDQSDVPSTGLATGSTANQLRFTATYLTDA